MSVFKKHLAAKKEKGAVILVSGKPDLIKKFDGKSIAQIADENGVPEERGIILTEKGLENGNTIYSVVMKFGNNAQMVFGLSKALASQVEDLGGKVNGLEMLDWEARKVQVPVFMKNEKGELVKTDEKRDSLVVGKAFGEVSWDEEHSVEFGDDVDPALAEGATADGQSVKKD